MKMKDKKMPKDMQAKQDVLKEMMQMAMEAMRGKNKHGMDEMMNMKKVSVMAPDDESLEAGLDKAKEVLEAREDGEEEGSDEEDMEMEDEEGMMAELSDEQKKLMLKKLMKKA
jgi:pyruvate-formate lyase